MTISKINVFVFFLLGAVAFLLSSCGETQQQETISETTVTPTEGMITTVKEVEANQFKIEDEEVVPDPADSRIIAKYLDNTVDTMTLQEAQVLAAQEENNGGGVRRNSMLLQAASFGLMGYMMGRRMGSFRPQSNAYVDQKTYNRVSNGAGARMNQSAKRTTTTRPSGNSGYGAGKSTRSYGG
jgi:hypothetical protein